MPNILNDAVYSHCRRDFVLALVLAVLGPMAGSFLWGPLGLLLLLGAMFFSALGIGELKSAGLFNPPTPRSTPFCITAIAVGLRVAEFSMAGMVLAKAYPQAALLAAFALVLEIVLWWMFNALFSIRQLIQAKP